MNYNGSNEIACVEESDGICDAEYNIPHCGFDAGDCIHIYGNESLVDLYPDCIRELLLRYDTDGDENISWSTETEKVGNGICDTSIFNIDQCGFEFGECVKFNEEFPLCNNNNYGYGVEVASKLGDGVCDTPFNNRECQYDRGDCSSQNTNIGIAKGFALLLIIVIASVVVCITICGGVMIRNRRQYRAMSIEMQRNLDIPVERPTRLRQTRLRRRPTHMADRALNIPIGHMQILGEDRRNDILSRIIQKVCNRYIFLVIVKCPKYLFRCSLYI